MITTTISLLQKTSDYCKNNKETKTNWDIKLQPKTKEKTWQTQWKQHWVERTVNYDICMDGIIECHLKHFFKKKQHDENNKKFSQVELPKFHESCPNGQLIVQ